MIILEIRLDMGNNLGRENLQILQEESITPSITKEMYVNRITTVAHAKLGNP